MTLGLKGEILGKVEDNTLPKCHLVLITNEIAA